MEALYVIQNHSIHSSYMPPCFLGGNKSLWSLKSECIVWTVNHLTCSHVFCIDHYISALCMLLTGNVFHVGQEVRHLTSSSSSLFLPDNPWLHEPDRIATPRVSTLKWHLHSSKPKLQSSDCVRFILSSENIVTFTRIQFQQCWSTSLSWVLNRFLMQLAFLNGYKVNMANIWSKLCFWRCAVNSTLQYSINVRDILCQTVAILFRRH